AKVLVGHCGCRHPDPPHRTITCYQIEDSSGPGQPPATWGGADRPPAASPVLGLLHGELGGRVRLQALVGARRPAADRPAVGPFLKAALGPLAGGRRLDSGASIAQTSRTDVESEPEQAYWFGASVSATDRGGGVPVRTLPSAACPCWPTSTRRFCRCPASRKACFFWWHRSAPSR